MVSLGGFFTSMGRKGMNGPSTCRAFVNAFPARVKHPKKCTISYGSSCTCVAIRHRNARRRGRHVVGGTFLPRDGRPMGVGPALYKVHGVGLDAKRMAGIVSARFGAKRVRTDHFAPNRVIFYGRANNSTRRHV